MNFSVPSVLSERGKMGVVLGWWWVMMADRLPGTSQDSRSQVRSQQQRSGPTEEAVRGHPAAGVAGEVGCHSESWKLKLFLLMADTWGSWSVRLGKLLAFPARPPRTTGPLVLGTVLRWPVHHIRV